MSLPYQTKVVLPFDIATAQDMNERHANDVALANGSGLDDAAVTPIKRTGGFYIGTIPGATLSSTGNKSITGVGFKAKLVKFSLLETTDVFGASSAGSMTSSAQYAIATASNDVKHYRTSSSARCIMRANADGVISLEASYVSMDNDGFTISVITAGNYSVAYEAYA